VSGSARPRRGGVIAAGRGDRLRGAGPLKPLVVVACRPLIDHVLSSMVEANVTELVIAVNEDSRDVQSHVTASRWPFDIRWIVESTPSSMHTFLLVVESLAARCADEESTGERFLISTVDTVARPGAFGQFVELSSSADVTLALTRHIDDDKPLRVDLDAPAADGRLPRVIAIGGNTAGEPALATAGYYLVRPSVLREAKVARANLSALREFFAHLLERGYRLDGAVMSDSIDVDRLSDIEAAERFLRGGPATAAAARA